LPDDDTTTDRARFASCADVRAWYKSMYRGMPIFESGVEQTCKNYGIPYIARYADQPAVFHEFWEREA
jgi:hypothetical protein